MNSRSSLEGEGAFPKGEEITLRQGRRVRLYRAGDAQAQTVVFFCHGAGGRSAQWRSLWPLLAGWNAHFIAWDMPGHGQSPRPLDSATYAGTEMAGDFIELLERFGRKRNLIVSHSYGAKLTLAVLQTLQSQGRANRIERAALLGSPAPAQAWAATGLLRLPAWLLGLFRKKLERGFRAAAWHESASAQLIDEEERHSRRNSLRVFKALALQAPVLDVAMLDQLKLPVLLLTGVADNLTPIRAAQAVASALPNAQLRVLERCGHQVMLEQPEETAALLASFFAVDCK